ncbi:MAG: hypothetical protein IMY86_12155, partial [Chloroflexi bacterium]|nr:hypothetical protein [Chloroflexota bacterium]
MTNPITRPIDQPTNRPTVTVETALWALVVVVALTLRLTHLDAAPLNSHEAHEAMLAWRAVTGRGMPEGDYSPLLFAANALLFFLCGASDALARLWPALLGGALALVPFLFRRRVGRVGALVAGLYLAISPTVLFASRQLDGAILAAAGGMTFLGGIVRFSDAEKRCWLTLSSVGLALAVTANSSAYGLLLAMGLAWLSLVWAWPDEKARRLTESLRPHLGHMLVVFACTGLALSTGLGWNPAGLGAAGGLLSAWLARFGPVSNPAASPFTLIAVYEPLALLFGLGGLTWAVRRGHRFGLLLGLWAGLGALLLALTPGRSPTDTLWVVLPLALLAGLALESLVRSLRTRRVQQSSEWLYVPVVLVLWIYLYLRLVRYATVGDSLDLYLASLSLVLQGLMAVVFALGLGTDGVLRVGVVGVGVVLLAITLSAGWGIAYVRPADPQELLVHEPTAIEVRDLVQTLRDLSWRRTGAPTTLPFTFEAAPDSVMAWYLRDFDAARRVESLAGLNTGEIESVVVTSQRNWMVPDDVSYVGQDFVLRRSWNPSEITCVWSWPPQCSV